MLVPSRLLPIARRLFYKKNVFIKPFQPIRNESVNWAYRSSIKEQTVKAKRSRYLSYGLMTFLWYWVLYHVWYDWDLVAPTHPRPDPSKWTDEELGIPPDGED